MSVTAERLQALLPDLAPSFIENHVRRLDERYFQRFGEGDIADHVRRLSQLSPRDPVRTVVREIENGRLECTVLAFDYPSVFSLITGVLSSLGFDTLAGDVFTYAPWDGLARQTRENHRSRRRAGAPDRDRRPSRDGDTGKRRLIIDCFTGTTTGGVWGEEWEEELSSRLQQVIILLERGGNDSLSRAKQSVYEMAARAVTRAAPSESAVLYPVTIEVDASPPGCTRMRVVSQDTPFFLFTFSTALSLQGVSIEHVRIRTEGGRIEDEFEFVDASGRKIEEPGRIDRIKLSVLVTKQFTTFLGGSPDPLSALQRFENLMRDIVPMSEQGRWSELLSNQHVLSDLAQLLGASTYLWEDFIRLQYETLLPMLRPHVGGKSFCEPIELLPERLELALAGAKEEEEFARRLNEFKDREIYLFDLDHILTPGSDFLTLSKRLTALAEVVVDCAASFAYEALLQRFGEPRTVAGIPVRYAIVGLGKMGGAALGYASDIELLFVYSDSGTTGAPDSAAPAVSIENAEFFGRLARETQRLVHAKREGIFHIDLRLRPYGDAGPLACSLESFCTYYPRGGPAHSYERLSLVRLRSVGGDRQLAARIERLRDEMVYAAQSIELEELWELRERQVREKTKGGALNAKFSPGALVDLEYAVQILQVLHGAQEKRLRTPRIHEALDALALIGVLERPEAKELADAYHFFRRLINGLRMLRGSAQDLFLPSLDSDEYMHLARRSGYKPEREMSPARKLHLDFETHTAEVRAFMERHFGRGSLPGIPAANVADLILSDTVPEGARRDILSAKGFRDPARAFVNLRELSGEAERRSQFARLAILACDILSQRPDPDMALNNWERFLRSLDDPQGHFRGMLSQPMRLEILLSIFSTSQFLADALVRNPELLDYIGASEVLRSLKGHVEIQRELASISNLTAQREGWRDELRRFRRREILRIGARDICLGMPTRTVMEELSELADGVVSASLGRLRGGTIGRGGEPGAPPWRFCVIAFGKLGGRELNYSSDIDLLGLYDGGTEGADPTEDAAALMEALRADLSDHTMEGYAYRVDLRLRPYGSSGQLVFSLKSLLEYYSRSAAMWELQALLKARPVAGDLELGREFLDSVRTLLLAPREPSAVVSSIDRLRKEAQKSLSRNSIVATDIKVGLGGLRDVEFLVQGLELIHAHEHPELLIGNTLAALEALGTMGILPTDEADRLVGDYIFLRRVEHFLQIYEDRQTHSLPRDPLQMLALARRMLGSGATEGQFHSKLAKRFERVREEYRKFTETGFRQ